MWSLIDMGIDTLLIKMDFHFVISNRLQTASWSETGPWLHVPILEQDPIWLEPVEVLCVLPQPLCSCVQSVLLYLEDTLLGLIHHTWLLQSFCFLFCVDVWAFRKGGWWHPLMTSPSAPKSLALCTLFGCGSLCWFPSFFIFKDLFSVYEGLHIYMSTTHVPVACRAHKEGPGYPGTGVRAACGCWELNLGPMWG